MRYRGFHRAPRISIRLFSQSKRGGEISPLSPSEVEAHCFEPLSELGLVESTFPLCLPLRVLVQWLFHFYVQVSIYVVSFLIQCYLTLTVESRRRREGVRVPDVGRRLGGQSIQKVTRSRTAFALSFLLPGNSFLPF